MATDCVSVITYVRQASLRGSVPHRVPQRQEFLPLLGRLLGDPFRNPGINHMEKANVTSGRRTFIHTYIDTRTNIHTHPPYIDEYTHF
ncbi:hypothetical protein scyTo_0005152 [Scyliorhinus torazame]|uniref:Uncharacterized protein n=1 Tax=Scyliorhinus torazame TaxID=75743 RepID=A0A401P383_SCYTO|nr:hypothetical protein [Scyliorhinus torazame]